jgi:hypothetical protein
MMVLIGFGAVQKALMTLMCAKECALITDFPIVVIEPVDISESEIFK